MGHAHRVALPVEMQRTGDGHQSRPHSRPHQLAGLYAGPLLPRTLAGFGGRCVHQGLDHDRTSAGQLVQLPRHQRPVGEQLPVEFHPALLAGLPGTRGKGLPVLGLSGVEALEQLECDNSLQCFQRCERQTARRLVLEAEGGELIDIERHRRQHEQLQGAVGQALHLARGGRRQGFGEQQRIRVQIEGLAQGGANHSQHLGRARNQA